MEAHPAEALEIVVEGPKLSEEARRSLEERVRILEEERIPRLEEEVAASADPSSLAALRRTREEVNRLRDALSLATPLEEPRDPNLVELGDTVTVRRAGSSSEERFTLVGELEARLDESWVSIESPLGSALLGSRVGDVMEISPPGGPVRYELLSIERRT